MPLDVNDLVPLDPEALLTDAERSDLVDVFNTANGHRTALASAEANLETFIRDRATDDVGMMFDYFGDGELVPANQAVRLGGRRPDAIHEKRIEKPHPPDSPPPAASAAIRAQARALWNNRNRAQERYTESAGAFNDALNRIYRRPMCSTNTCVDVFGDGLLKFVADCFWPEPIEIYNGRLVSL